MLKVVLALLLAVFAAPVFAHTIAADGGFLTGFNHPVLGFDHLLAMLSVGVLSTQFGGRMIWTLPLAFMAFMLMGGMLGLLAISVPFVEMGISLSVLLLGMAIALDRRIPVLFAMGFVGFFAIFHGHAHGVEMPELAAPWVYVLGFLTGTAVIHAAGVVIGLSLQNMGSRAQYIRVAGVAISLTGGYLLFGVLL